MTYPEFLEEWRSESPFIVAYTSGSTGKPRRVELPKEVVRESARRTIGFFRLGPCSRLHSCISPSFIGGKMMAVRAEVCGGRLSWEEPSMMPVLGSSEEVLDLVAVVPAQMHHILDNLDKMPCVRNFLIGGSAIPDGLRRRIADLGAVAYESYGMTETASHIALRRVGIPQEPFCLLEGVGISTDDDNALTIRLEGLPELHTNDIVRFCGADRFEIIGRKDNVINTGGKKISAEEIEAMISRKAADVSFYIVGCPHPVWGEEIVLVTDCREGSAEDMRLADGIAGIAEHWQRPKRIVRVESMPHTPSGKIIRARL